MKDKKIHTIINCISSSMLAYFFTVPVHESFHAITRILYGGSVRCFSAGAVDYNDSLDIASFSSFDRIMVGGGSASLLNAVIAIILLIIVMKNKDLGSMARLFLTQLMFGHALEGFGYFLIGGLFGAGDWGSVFNYFSDSPATVTAMRIILSAIGCASAMTILYLATYMTYYFVEDPSDKAQRKEAAAGLNLSLFLVCFVIADLACISLPVVKSGLMSYWLFVAFNMMWFPILVAFFYGWGGIMVKPPKETLFRCKLPDKPNWALFALGVILNLIDIIIFGPGIYFG